MSQILIQPAAAAGFASLFGHIAKGTGDTLDLPQGMVNIGGNGRGYLLAAQTNWDPAANDDGTIASLELGDDIYIYAVEPANGGYADWIASKNATMPDGYTAENSRKMGGFHFGRWRPIAHRYDKTYMPGVQILPNSCWDVHHRPKCDPSGMVEVIPGRLWADIYLNSEGPGAWPEKVPESRYGVTPLSGSEGYARYLDFPVLAANAGKRLPSLHEFYVYADGTPEGNDGNNDTAWSATSNTGRATTGTVAKAVSCKGIVDAAGNLWEPCTDLYDSAGSWAWDRAMIEIGRDAGELRGELRHARWRVWVAGGDWSNGARCGSRCAHSDRHPEGVDSRTGLRCVCDAL